MKKLLIFSLLLLLAFIGTATAGRDTFGVSWNMSVPAGDTADFTSGMMFRGGSLEWHTFPSRKTSWGINAGWDVFTQSFDSTLNEANFAFTGKARRYVNAAPVYASWTQYFRGDGRGKMLFVGLNAGTAYIVRRTEVGVFQFNERNWHLALAPEFGLKMPWDVAVGWVALRYNYAFSAGEVNDQQWFELRIGFGMD